GNGDVELPPHLRAFLAVSEKDGPVRSCARVFDPSDKFVVVGLGERRGECEDFGVLVQLRLPSFRDWREGVRRVDDWHRILDADGERLRPVHANAALRTQPSANIPQVGNGPAEFGAGVRKRPLAADRREDAAAVAEAHAGWAPSPPGETRA